MAALKAERSSDRSNPVGAGATVRWQKNFFMRVNKATIGQWSAKYIAGMRAARSLEWRCLWSCMGTMAWCAADFRATQPRQLGAARSDFGPGTARRPPDRQEMQRHRARALCDHRRPCWQRSGRSCRASPEPLPLGPAAAANAPLPGMLQRAWPCALRCHHRSAHLHHFRAFRAIGHSSGTNMLHFPDRFCRILPVVHEPRAVYFIHHGVSHRGRNSGKCYDGARPVAVGP